MLYKSLWVIDDKKVHKTLLEYTDNIHSYPEGSFIYHQEDDRTCLFFLIEGRIKVNLSDANGSEKTLAIHESGSFFGETAFFDQKPSFANALVLKDSKILAFNKKQLSLLFKEHPEIIYHVFESMSRKIRLLSFQVEYLSFMKIEQRLVVLLLTFFESFGKNCSKGDASTKKTCTGKKNCPHGHLLKLNITDQEIADMIGTRREAVTKAITSLKKQNLIYKQNRMICCPDLSKLQDFLSYDS